MALPPQALKGLTMANLTGTKGNDFLDAIQYGNSNDSIFGDDGNDVMLGWNGNDYLDGWNGDDTLYGEAGNDVLLGFNGYDKLYGGAGNDTLNGEGTFDDLYGGAGKDTLTGGDGADYFYFGKTDSGDVFANQADTITDFSDQDQIFLKGNYGFAGNTAAPADGQYGIWQNNGNWTVTWNDFNDNGYHDVTVKGGDPNGDVSFW
jgi:Ca2+-binding RTX toxin-like protein